MRPTRRGPVYRQPDRPDGQMRRLRAFVVSGNRRTPTASAPADRGGAPHVRNTARRTGDSARSARQRVHLDGQPLVARGDLRADHLYETFRQRLCLTAARYGGQDAEGVMQDAFRRAFRFGTAFRGDSAPLTWLHCIVVNESHREIAAVDTGWYVEMAIDPGACTFAGDAPG